MDDFPDVESAFDDMCASMARGLDTEHLAVDEPSETALMHRKSFVMGAWREERMWLNGYPRNRMIIMTVMPVPLAEGGELRGVVRETPVSHRDMASAEAFSARFAREVAMWETQGWRVSGSIPRSDTPETEADL